MLPFLILLLFDIWLAGGGFAWECAGDVGMRMHVYMQGMHKRMYKTENEREMWVLCLSGKKEVA